MTSLLLDLLFLAMVFQLPVMKSMTLTELCDRHTEYVLIPACGRLATGIFSQAPDHLLVALYLNGTALSLPCSARRRLPLFRGVPPSRVSPGPPSNRTNCTGGGYDGQ